MNKYIKLDGLKKLINACEWRMTLAKERHGEGFVDYSKQVLDADELAKRVSDLPTIEVSEDCISRAWVLDKIHAYAEAYTTSTGASVGADYCAEFVENAPSVVPK